MAIQVTYRLTSRLSMRIVKNGDVHVSAPIGIPAKKVKAFIYEHRDWIVEARKKTQERVQARADFYEKLPLTTRKQRDEAKEQLKEIIEPMIQKYAEKMGVTPGTITFKKMVSRWGQCDVKTHHICFSIYVLLLPDWCKEHIVVHELCHLLEPSHNTRFHTLMAQYFPRWREARKQTRQLLTT